MKTVLITGASSGIGREFAKAFMRQGCNLFLVGRDKTRLQTIVEELKKEAVGEVYGITADLSKPGLTEKVYKWIDKNGHQKIDLLVNNAGVGYFGELLDMTNHQMEELLQLNVNSLVKLTYFFTKSMVKENREGAVINVSSVLGFFPFPYSAIYAASKAFVLHFSEALSEELKESKVKILTVCPGTTKTNFFDRAKGRVELNRKGGIFKFNPMMEPEAVVMQSIRALNKGKVVEVNGIHNKLTVWFVTRLVPRSMVRCLAAKISRKGFASH